MATIDKTSSLSDIRDAFLDNLSYRTDGSTTKALAFIEACIAMLDNGIRVIDQGGERVEYTPDALLKLKDEARVFVTANTSVANGGSGAKHFDFRYFRS